MDITVTCSNCQWKRELSERERTAPQWACYRCQTVNPVPQLTKGQKVRQKLENVLLGFEMLLGALFALWLISGGIYILARLF